MVYIFNRSALILNSVQFITWYIESISRVKVSLLYDFSHVLLHMLRSHARTLDTLLPHDTEFRSRLSPVCRCVLLEPTTSL